MDGEDGAGAVTLPTIPARVAVDGTSSPIASVIPSKASTSSAFDWAKHGPVRLSRQDPSTASCMYTARIAGGVGGLGTPQPDSRHHP